MDTIKWYGEVTVCVPMRVSLSFSGPADGPVINADLIQDRLQEVMAVRARHWDDGRYEFCVEQIMDGTEKLVRFTVAEIVRKQLEAMPGAQEKVQQDRWATRRYLADAEQIMEGFSTSARPAEGSDDE